MLEKLVLVIDDDPGIRKAMPIICDDLGYNCRTSVSYSSDVLEGVDLIILDIKLPKIDGYEVYQEIKKIKDIPIIFHSAYAGENENKYKELKPFDYIDKGSKDCYEKLVDAIGRALE